MSTKEQRIPSKSSLRNLLLSPLSGDKAHALLPLLARLEYMLAPQVVASAADTDELNELVQESATLARLLRRDYAATLRQVALPSAVALLEHVHPKALEALLRDVHMREAKSKKAADEFHWLDVKANFTLVLAAAAVFALVVRK
jgi:hypothetical protein